MLNKTMNSPSFSDSRPIVSGANSNLTTTVNALGNTLWSGIAALAKRITAWKEVSRQRRDLHTLSDHILKDLGITRYEAEKEANKPFWKQ